MRYRRTERFRKAFQALPPDVQEKAVKAFRLMDQDLHHPSLRIKKVQGAGDIWEGRVNRQCRFTFEREVENGEEVIVFRNIDNHDECLKRP